MFRATWRPQGCVIDMKTMKTTLKATLVATAIATFPFAAHAAGLGAINVFSGLGQPLLAEIELQATPEELQGLTARVASVDAFRQAQLGYTAVMASLNFAIQPRGDGAVVRVTSDRPINEPFLEMLVELNWSNGRVLREYTVLLDPVDLVRPPVSAALIQPPTAPSAAAAVPSTATAPPASAPRAAPAPTTRGPVEYRVQRGDTLRAIAAAHRPADVTIEQMLVALLRQNPNAFDGNNMNRLRAGAILTIPDASVPREIEVGQARREVVAQSSDFEAYRQRLAGVAAAAPAAAAPDTREAVGQITARVDDPPETAAPTDRVQVSGAPSEGDTEQLARLQALEEELVARERSLEEANSRLAELEQSIRDLQRLVELRNETLAQLQEQLVQSGETGVDPVMVPREAVAPETVEPIAETSTTDEATVSGEPISVPADETAAPLVEEPPQVAAPAQETSPVAVAPSAPPVVEDAPQPRPAPVAPPMQPQPTFLQSLLDDPMMMAAGGGVLVLLLGYAGYRVRQRRKTEPEPISGLSEYPSEGHSVFGGKGGQSVDTGSSSVLHTDFSQSGLSAIDADEGVDPVAEADVYMAYGRDAQAEEILLDALKADASRPAIYLKLLEIYAQRESPRQFESVATDLYSRTEGLGDDWKRAAEMGRKLDPENPLYSAGPMTGDDAPMTEPGAGGRAAGSATAAAAAGVAGAAAASALGGGEQKDGDEFAAASGEQSLDEVDFTTSMPMQPTASQLKDTWSMPGELSQLSRAIEEGSADDVGKAIDSAVQEQGEAEPDSEDVDFSVLDFDLGSEAGSGQKSTAEPGGKDGVGAEPAPSVEDTGLSFDLDMGDLSAPAKEVAASGEMDVERSNSGLDFDVSDASASPKHDASLDATMIGDAADLAAAERAADAAAGRSPGTDEAATFDLDATMVDDELAAIHAGRSAPEAAPGEVDDSVMDLEKTGFDNSLLDFDFDLDAPAQSSDDTPAIDLSNIDLDLDPDAPAQSASFETSADAAGDDLLEEADTKLDLARAYEEMGDVDGARELIEEVLREGSAAQQEKAKAMLNRLG